jgi:hypothetical protein
VGRRLLAALEGQPDECQSPRCEKGRREYSVISGPCTICNGTGHNLRGVLSPVVSPAIRRKVADATAQLDHAQRWDGTCWVDTMAKMMPFGWARLLQAMPGDKEPELHAQWRVVPRGEHRDLTQTGDSSLYPHDRYATDQVDAMLPRWRRGELRHAQQRRERERAVRSDSDIVRAAEEYIATDQGRSMALAQAAADRQARKMDELMAEFVRREATI